MSATPDSSAEPLGAHWTLEPETVYLNHGSFGACPAPVLSNQRRWRERMEAQPMRFFVRELQGYLDAARAALASFLGTRPDDLAFVTNATTGVNAVLRSLQLGPDDEVLTTNHTYPACRDTLAWLSERTGVRVIVAHVPFPLSGPDSVVEGVMARVTPATRLALLDHVTSPTGLVFPIERLVEALAGCGVDVLVDGAHAPGMLRVDLDRLGAAYYAGNCHKWLCAPKGAGFLHVRRDRREGIHPVVTSLGYSFVSDRRSRFHLEFDWQGTFDPTAWLSLPKALSFMDSLLPGGWPALMKRNRDLALEARRCLCDALDVPEPCPDSMIGCLAAVPLPDGSGDPAREFPPIDPLQAALWEQYRIEVPVISWPEPPGRVLRISAQVYNSLREYERLAQALRRLVQP